MLDWRCGDGRWRTVDIPAGIACRRWYPPGARRAQGEGRDNSVDSRAQAWYGRRTWHWRDWPAEALLEGKRRADARISVVIPARNEERTVAGVVGSLRAALVERIPLIDEVVVIDSDSADGTATAAAKAGATVHRARDIAPALGAHPGKGEALWKSLLVTDGDLLVFIDADLTQWGPHFVTGLLGPLLADPGVLLVKGFYARVATGTDGSTSTEGGRVTELVARPLLSLWWPAAVGRGPAAGRRMGGAARPDGVAQHPGGIRGGALHPARHGRPARAGRHRAGRPGFRAHRTRPTTTWP